MKKVTPNNLLHAFILLLILATVIKSHGAGINYSWLDSRPAQVPSIRLFEINLNDPYQRNSEEFEATADQSYMDRIINEAPNYFDLETGIGKTIRMTRVRLHTDDFKLSLLGTDIATLPYEAGIHYRGLYNDGNGAISSLSFINGKLHGLIVEEGSQWEIAAIEEENGKYLFRKSESSGSISGFSCGILEVPGRKMTEIDNNTQGIACKTVKVSLECDYKIFRDFQQNAVATADYISALMNQVSALYQSENIDLQIQEIKVWTSDDPYSSISTAGELLTAFRTTKGSNFNGTLSHFLTTRSIGGGMAFLDVLCNKDYAHGVSSILTFFNNAPSYSWSVEVLAHELGHNFGSNHTHWCGWQRADGTTGPLDNCYSSDGGCSPGPTPQNGGTIMSYCHLTTQGINFSKGFGTEPGSVIRERLTNSTCIASGGSEPIGTTTTNINATTARLEWAPVPNAINYEAEYRLSGTTTWIQAGTSVGCFIQLNQLSSGTNYEWHVKTNCSSYGNSNYFTTTSVNTCSNPTGLVLTSITGISATLNWQAVSGCSRYQFQYRKAGMSTWVSVENIIGNVYQLTGLTGTTTYNWRVKADCSSYSAISNFTTTSSGCPVPASITTTNITTTGAKLNWTSSNGASSYIVSYKDQRESRWKSTNTTTTNLSLTGLIPGTGYEWKVRSNCSNTTISSSFRTMNSLSMAIMSPSRENIDVYPNPASDIIRIDTRPGESFGFPFKAIVTDILGKEKSLVVFDGNNAEVDITSFDEGVYLIQIIDTDGKTENKRFMKR